MDDDNSIAATQKTLLFLSQKNKRKRWKQAETDLFLKCVVPRLGEFRSRRKIYAFQNVLKDMFDQGFMDKSVTPAALEGKFRTLSIAYDAYKDNPFPGSPTTHIQPHLKELEIIFGGSKSAFKEDHSNESADESVAIRSENVSSDYEMESFTFSDNEDPLLEVKKQSSETETIMDAIQRNSKERKLFSPTQNVVKESLTELSSANYDRDCAKQEYYEAKLDYKKRSLALKAKFYSDIKDLFKEKFKREEIMEREKLEVLKQIAERLCKS